MTTTTYYNLNIAEGTDIVNPLTVDNPNYQKIDEAMHDNAVAGVTLATELTNATIHALTRENSDCSVIRFIATSNWKAGDSVTVDGVPVLALLPSGETLPNGAYVINSNVLCVLTGTNLTVYVSKSSANASDITYKETNVEEALNSLNESMVTVTSNLSTVSNNVSTINSNLALALSYNENTDYFGITYNGEWRNVLFAGFQTYYLYRNGDDIIDRTGGWTTDGFTLASGYSKDGTTTKNNDNISMVLGAGAAKYTMIGTVNTVDLSNKNTLKMEYVENGSTKTIECNVSAISNAYVCISLRATPDNSLFADIFVSSVKTNSFNNESASNSAALTTRQITVSKVWAE